MFRLGKKIFVEGLPPPPPSKGKNFWHQIWLDTCSDWEKKFLSRDPPTPQVKGKIFDTKFGLIHVQTGKKFFCQGTPSPDSKKLLWLRGGRYASCVHARGLSCLFEVLSNLCNVLDSTFVTTSAALSRSSIALPIKTSQRFCLFFVERKRSYPSWTVQLIPLVVTWNSVGHQQKGLLLSLQEICSTNSNYFLFYLWNSGVILFIVVLLVMDFPTDAKVICKGNVRSIHVFGYWHLWAWVFLLISCSLQHIFAVSGLLGSLIPSVCCILERSLLMTNIMFYFDWMISEVLSI